MAETETQEVVSDADASPAVEAPVADDAAKEPAGDAVTDDAGKDTVASDAADDESAETDELELDEPIVTATPAEAVKAYETAVATRDGLLKQQADVDAQLEELDKQITAGDILPDQAGAKISILVAKQHRLERQVAAAENAVAQKDKENAGARTNALTERWNALGKQYSDLGEGDNAEAKAASATLMLQRLWDQEMTKASIRKGMHPERVAGIAEANWEMRVKALRAQKGKPGATNRSAPERLTPGSGSGPVSPKKESGAVIAERTLGPLSQFKF